MSLAYLLIEDDLLDELLSALRRHDLADGTRLLRRWQDRPAPLPDFKSFGKDCLELTIWVQREAGLHVAGGCAEHALCLIERYRPQVDEHGDLYRENGQGLFQ